MDGDWAGEPTAPPPQDPEDPSNEGDQFEDVGTNPFTMTAHDHLSTFAADVDTASYDIFRRDINYGYLPRSESVRLEEFVNYFPYDYEAPTYDNEVPFEISLAAVAGPFVNETNLLRVGIKGRDAPPEEKKPANLVFLIDISGSMRSAVKLPLVKKVLTETLDVLEETDRVAIVTYAGSTGVALESTPVSERETIEAVIESFSAGGSTAGGAGITLAYEQAEANFIPGGINHVILCTDGDFNVGLSDRDALVELIEEKRRTGITLTVLGFGTGNLNDRMMESISNAGNGMYAVISDEDQAVSYAHDRMLSTLVLIAQDLKIQVEFNAAKVAAYRLLGYENRAIADHEFRDDKVDAGEVGSGHTITALYELAFTEAAIPKPEGAPEVLDGDPTEEEATTAEDDLCIVRVRYKAVGAGEEDPAMEVASTLKFADAGSDLMDADADFRWAAAVAAFAEILKDSPYASDANLTTIETLIDGAAGDDLERGEFKYLFGEAVKLLNAPTE